MVHRGPQPFTPQQPDTYNLRELVKLAKAVRADLEKLQGEARGQLNEVQLAKVIHAERMRELIGRMESVERAVAALASRLTLKARGA